MIYKKIHISYDCRDYSAIIAQIDSAIETLLNAIATNVLEQNIEKYKMDTGQSDVEVSIDTEKDAVNMIARLEKLRTMYTQMARNRVYGRSIRLRDQNNFR